MDYTDLPFEDSLRGSDGEMMIFALDRVHQQFAWKTGGLTAEQLRQTHPPSRMTLGGLIRHLTGVEENWTAAAAQRAPRSLWGEQDPVAEEAWGWSSALTAEPDELYSQWYATVRRCRAEWLQLIAEPDGLDVVLDDGTDYVVNRRRRLMDILEENLLHTGQASMLREAVDGLVGNDPP